MEMTPTALLSATAQLASETLYLSSPPPFSAQAEKDNSGLRNKRIRCDPLLSKFVVVCGPMLQIAAE
jgi:hypothetical protein